MEKELMEKEQKKKLIGECGKIHATYDHEIPIGDLNKPLEKGAVTRFFCQGSGSILSLNRSEAIGLLTLLSKKPEEKINSFSNGYFYSGACPYCDGDKSFLEFRKIPRE
jgi:hypothetical protein